MIPAVILAAGLSSRMGGRPKALLSVPGGQTFIETLVRTFRAAAIEEIVVVVGHEAETVARAIADVDPRVRVVNNTRYASGQFSSVLAGLDAVDRPGVAGMLLTLVDVPLVQASTVTAVVERFKNSGAPVVRPVCGEQHGHPVLIARSLFPLLRAGSEDGGAKPVVRAHVSASGDVEVDDRFAFRDVDTPEQHAALLASTSSL